MQRIFLLKKPKKYLFRKKNNFKYFITAHSFPEIFFFFCNCELFFLAGSVYFLINFSLLQNLKGCQFFRIVNFANTVNFFYLFIIFMVVSSSILVILLLTKYFEFFYNSKAVNSCVTLKGKYNPICMLAKFITTSCLF
jgi:hypothetical protein